MRAQNIQFIQACMATCSTIFSKAVFKMSKDNLILHNLHFIIAHFSFITAHMSSDNPLF